MHFIKGSIAVFVCMYVCVYVCVTAKFLLLDRAAGIAVHSGAAAAGESRQQAFSPGQGMYVCINVLYTCVTNPCCFSRWSGCRRSWLCTSGRFSRWGWVSFGNSRGRGRYFAWLILFMCRCINSMYVCKCMFGLVYWRCAVTPWDLSHIWPVYLFTRE